MSNSLKLPTTMKSRGIAAVVLACAFAASTQAAVIIPDKSGFSGYVNLGVGAVDVKSNMLAKIASGHIDVGKATIDSLYDSPDSESSGIPMVNFELSYTLEKSRTQFHIGNLLEDFLRFDMNAILGVRQDVGNAGLIGANVRATSLATDVWRDPYVTDVKRKETERTGTGFRVYWQQIMSSGLELRYTTSEVDIDKERSGEDLGLSAAERHLLDRNGDNDRFDALYEFHWDGKRHILTPQLSYIDHDRDGDAMSNDGVSVGVNYIYQRSDAWRYVFNASYSDLDWKEINPVYGEKDSANSYGVSATVFYSEPFGWKKWAFNATAGYFDQDNDIDFYDSSVTMVGVGMFRKF